MENAGSAAARLIRSTYDVSGKSVVLLCGKGNNGGDGFVIARKLMDEEAKVSVILACGLPTSENALEMLSRISNSEVEIIRLDTEPYVAASCIRNAAIIVDAVYGIGFRGLLPDHIRPFFNIVKSCSAPVVAIDLPSGVNADTGEADPDTLKADLTITFTANKTGLVTPSGAAMCGNLQVVSIGIDERLLKPYSTDKTEINMDMVESRFIKRQADSNKGSFGRLLTFAVVAA